MIDDSQLPPEYLAIMDAHAVIDRAQSKVRWARFRARVEACAAALASKEPRND